jgi:parallel beta-helix repeat protein
MYSTVSSCLLRSNTLTGATVSDFSVVNDCTVLFNTGNGIQGTANCLVENNSVYSNSAAGVVITDNGRVSGCQVAYNGGNGITSGNFSPVVSNTSRSNTGNGIAMGTNSLVSGNICTSNGGSTAAGVLATGNGCPIHDNDLIDNGIGIKVTASNCSIFGNRAHGDSLGDYVIATGNDFGPTGTAATVTSPWANISY